MALQKLTGDINRDLQSQIDYFSGVNQPYVSDAFRSIKNERDGLFGSFRNDLLNQYDAFQKSINPSFNQFLQTSSNIADQLLPQINQQGQLIQQKFGPEGEFVGQANAYYKNLANAVNNAISGNISGAQNQAVRSGASQTAINQALQQARSAGLNDIAKIQAEKLAQQQSMLTNFLQLQDALRKQKFDYQNELIRNPLLALNERVSQIGQSLLGGLQGISNAEMQQLLLDKARAQDNASVAQANALALQQAQKQAQQQSTIPQQVAQLNKAYRQPLLNGDAYANTVSQFLNTSR